MAVVNDLASGALVAHSLESARVLESLPAEESALFLSKADTDATAVCLRLMQSAAAARILAALEVSRAAEILDALPLDAAAACLRHLDEAAREPSLQAMKPRGSRALRTSLRFAPNTAGALMDPHVLALPLDLDVEAARSIVRETPQGARYNLYVVDRDQRLLGVFNLRELFLADGVATLRSIMTEHPHRLPAEAHRRAIVAHPGWREVHALPVVDRAGVYLGAIRYRTLRRLEEELRVVAPETGATARALGDLFRTGASSLLEAVASTPVSARSPGESPDVG
jgi:magnesium transporter